MHAGGDASAKMTAADGPIPDSLERIRLPCRAGSGAAACCPAQCGWDSLTRMKHPPVPIDPIPRFRRALTLAALAVLLLVAKAHADEAAGSAPPRAEYPRPQFVRDAWANLNGTWTCELDLSRSGYDAGEMLAEGGERRSRRLWKSRGFDREITVPFCPESRLSGIGHTDFIDMMWYHRSLEIPADWTGRILLHFGGVDYRCDAFIDGRLVGRHAGGQSAFSFDVTRFVSPGGRHDLVLMVRDDVRANLQPAGKQSGSHASHGCHYTRVTGIWQTVWMEPVPDRGLRDVQIIPDLDRGRFHLLPSYWSVAAGHSLRATLSSGGRPVATAVAPQVEGVPVAVEVSDPRPWEPGSPHLYDLVLEVLDGSGAVVDRVVSYAGLRKVHVENGRLHLNNRPLYLRMVLDQGYYPDGIWTAPSDEALRRDIELAMAAGFNGARLHQKVFEPRFHYWADRLGYLTWGEASSWGCNASSPEGRDNFLREWREILLRDRSHPSIIAWTPWNEMWWISNEEHFGRTLIETYELTRAIDPTRPVHTASGGGHCRTDLWTVHCYDQAGAGLARVAGAGQDANLERAQKAFGEARPHAGQPVVIDEFGGIKWVKPGGEKSASPQAANSWGYGDAPKDLEDFYRRLDSLVGAVLDVPGCSGYCYTQLTDVEQEVNGIYTYDRERKFDMDRIHAVFSREPAAGK